MQYIRKRSEFYGARLSRRRSRADSAARDGAARRGGASHRAPRGARVVDIGTGSGCIARHAGARAPRPARHRRRSLARRARGGERQSRTAAGERASLVASDLLDSIRSVDVIVSNPPYIRVGGRRDARSARCATHEPRMALTPGPRGTEVIERILDRCRRGTRRWSILLEIGYGQEESVRALAAAHRYRSRCVPARPRRHSARRRIIAAWLSNDRASSAASPPARSPREGLRRRRRRRVPRHQPAGADARADHPAQTHPEPRRPRRDADAAIGRHGDRAAPHRSRATCTSTPTAIASSSTTARPRGRRCFTSTSTCWAAAISAGRRGKRRAIHHRDTEEQRNLLCGLSL